MSIVGEQQGGKGSAAALPVAAFGSSLPQSGGVVWAISCWPGGGIAVKMVLASRFGANHRGREYPRRMPTLAPGTIEMLRERFPERALGSSVLLQRERPAKTGTGILGAVHRQHGRSEKRAGCCLGLGQLMEQMKDFESAISFYSRAFVLEPESTAPGT